MDGVSPVVLPCEISGPVPVPQYLSRITWRRGIDLNPLDVGDDDSVAWLETLVWPEHEDRRSRLAAAMSIARQDPATVVAGDLMTTVEDMAATVPSDATLVVFSSAVLAYLPRAVREAWVELAGALPGHCISNEAANVLPSVSATAPCAPPQGPQFALALDGQCVGWAHGHGRSLPWC